MYRIYLDSISLSITYKNISYNLYDTSDPSIVACQQKFEQKREVNILFPQKNKAAKMMEEYNEYLHISRLFSVSEYGIKKMAFGKIYVFLSAISTNLLQNTMFSVYKSQKCQNENADFH